MMKKRNFLRQNITKGSFTIEAACVMPLILLVLMGCLYLCFFVHNRAWLTAAAYESALAGSMEGVKEDGKVYETVQMRSRELGNIGFFGAENLTSGTNAGKTVNVSYSFDTIAGYGGFRWHFKAIGSSAVVCPVKWIRTIKAASETISMIGGE